MSRAQAGSGISGNRRRAARDASDDGDERAATRAGRAGVGSSSRPPAFNQHRHAVTITGRVPSFLASIIATTPGLVTQLPVAIVDGLRRQQEDGVEGGDENGAGSEVEHSEAGLQPNAARAQLQWAKEREEEEEKAASVARPAREDELPELSNLRDFTAEEQQRIAVMMIGRQSEAALPAAAAEAESRAEVAVASSGKRRRLEDERADTEELHTGRHLYRRSLQSTAAASTPPSATTQRRRPVALSFSAEDT